MTVTCLLTALTLKEATTVPAMKDLLEMATTVQVHVYRALSLDFKHFKCT